MDRPTVHSVEDVGAGSKPEENSLRANQKRQDYLSWEEYFMSVALLTAQRSKDPNTQVGACIVNPDNKIVSTGYNGMPNGCDDDTMPWGGDSQNVLETKKLYVCHAEMNAILNKGQADLHKCRIYVSLFPCNECAKLIVQSGITEVIYSSEKNRDKKKYKASRFLLNHARIQLRQYNHTRKEVVIDFAAFEDSD